jgi:hypothetical protein
LAKAKHIYNRDDELFDHKLVDLKALKNYGGGSYLALAREYLESFLQASNIESNKNIISYEEVISVFEP